MLITGSAPFPFITKDGSLDTVKFASISAADFSALLPGEVISGSYPLTSSISSDYYTTGNGSSVRKALKNTLNSYTNISQHYSYSSSYGDKDTQPFRLISIPSIYYGQSIKKGSVDLKFYVSGTLIGQLKDEKRNGEFV